MHVLPTRAYMKNSARAALFLALFLSSIYEQNADFVGQHMEKVLDCNETNEYLPSNQTYHFIYTLYTHSEAFRISNETTSFNISCYVIINAEGACYYSMHLSRCSLSDLEKDSQNEKLVPVDHPHSKYFSKRMTKYPVIFSLSGGKVGRLVAHKEEWLTILNLKRGIISSLIIKKSEVHNEQIEMRTDVQGTCPVTYRYLNSSVLLTKKMDECHFPDKLDWSYSPWSLFWNMSLIQNVWIDSHTVCEYKFNNDNGNFESTDCVEEHILPLKFTNDTGSTYVAKITQSLKLSKTTTLKPIICNPSDFHVTNIQYEYERDAIIKQNPPNLKQKVISLMEILITELGTPFSSDSNNAFEELIKLLRKSADLSEVAKEIPTCWNSHKCNGKPITFLEYNDYQFQVGQIWRDALVQCNRLPCFRAFRLLLNVNKGFLDHIVSDNYLNLVFLSWSTLKVNNVEYFKEMLEICKMKPSRPCILSITSAIHTFWQHNRSNLNNQFPRSILEVVHYVTQAMGSNCESSQKYNKAQIMLALKAVTNLGEVAEVAQPDISSRLYVCATNDKAHWPIPIMAIQAMKRLHSTNELYQNLLRIFKNFKSKQDHRISAYLVLIDKYGDAELMKEILKILKNETEEFNLQTFIISNLRAIVKARDTEKSEFAKLIRNAENKNPDAFHKKVDNLYVSKYIEHVFGHATPFLKESINRFSFRFTEAILRNKDTFLPYSLTDKLQMEIFGKKFDVYEVYSNSRGMMKSYEIFLSYFFNVESINVTEALRSVITVLNIINEKSSRSEPMNNFPYDIDDRIFQNLLKIRKERIASLKAALLSGENEAVFTLKVLGDELGFTTSELLQDDIYAIIKSWIIPPFNHEHPINTAKIKILEAIHQIPTLSGLTLTWASDAFLTHRMKEKKYLNYMNPNYKHDFDFSAMVTLKNRMIIELPGITNCGTETFNTLSTSIGAIVKMMHSYNDQTFNVSVEVPRRSLQLMHFTRQNSLIRRFQTVNISHPEGEAVSTGWCSELLVPLIGMKVCHNRSYLNIINRRGKPWTFIPPNSNWDLTMQYAMQNHDSYEVNFAVKRVNNKKIEKYGINLSLLDPFSSNNFLDIVNYSHVWDKEAGEHLIAVDVPRLPYLNAKAKFQKAEPPHLGQLVYAEATILPNMTFSFKYQAQKMQMKKKPGELKNYDQAQDGSERVLVEVQEHLVNFATPTENYIWNYTAQQYPQALVFDHLISCEKTGENSLHWFNPVMSKTIFGDKQMITIQLHQEIQHSAKNLSLIILPHLTYNYLKTPKSITEVDTFYGSTPNTERTIHVNITHRHLSNYELVTFLNFSTSLQHINENDGKFTVHKVNLSTPLISYSAGIKYGKVYNNYSATLIFKKKTSHPKTVFNPKSKISGRMLLQNPINSNIIHSKDDTITLEVNVDPHIRDIASGYYGLTSPLVYYNAIVILSFNDDQITFKTNPENVEKRRIGRNFMLDWSYKKLRWDSHLYMDNDVGTILFNSSIFRIPNYKYASYNLNLTQDQDSSNIVVTDQFDSNIYKHNSQLVWEKIYGTYFNFNISSYSPIWNIVNMNIKFSSLKSSESTNKKHFPSDVTLKMKLFDGYQGNFTVKGTNTEIIPTILGNIYFEGLNQGGSLQLNFPNVSREVYALYEVLNPYTDIKFTLCLQKKCNATESSPDFFVGQLNFVVVDGKNLETTLVLNKNNIRSMYSTFYNRKVKIVDKVSKEIYDPENAINKLLKPHLENKGPTLGHWIANFRFKAGRALEDSFSDLAEIPNSMKPIKDTIFGPIQHVYYYFLTNSYSIRALNWTNIPQVYRQLELHNSLPRWALQTFLKMAEEYFYVATHNSKSLYRLIIPLPLYRRTNNGYFSNANPAFFRPMSGLKFLAPHLPSYRDIFHDSKYTRFALFVDPGNIYTFEGIYIHLHHMLLPQCSYLLSHDFEKQQFSIYYHESNLHFLFPDTKVMLTPKGEIFVNGSRCDFPVEHWHREIQLSRKENLVEVNTKFNLKVVCDIEQFYCIFYTNQWKFNQLTGLLGNNNDNPTDDAKDSADTEKNYFTKYVSRYELSDNPQCKNVLSVKDWPYEPTEHQNECSSLSNSFAFDRSSFFSPTFLCHDIIPTAGFQLYCGRCSAFPCVNVKAYLAICGAEKVPVGGTPFECQSCGEQVQGDSWQQKVVKNLEIIFVIDQGHIRPSPTNYLKGLEILTNSIYDKFVDEGYKNITFGLVGFRGKGFRYLPQQHTMKSKLMGSVKEFIAFGIKSLEFLGPNDMNSDVVFDSLQHACDHYQLDPKASHMFILLTYEDPKEKVNFLELHKTLKQLQLHNVVLYAFSNFDVIAQLDQTVSEGNNKGYIGVQVNDRNVSIEFPKGSYSKLASATNGAFWQISHLEVNNMQQKMYLDAIADEMATSMTHDIPQCKTCKCSYPKYYQPQTLCELKCKANNSNLN